MNTSPYASFCDQVQVVATDVMGNSRTNVYQMVVPSGGVQSLSYDTTGNLLNDGAGKSYKWDNAGRLSKIITGGNEYSFGYDAEGRRVTERVSQHSRNYEGEVYRTGGGHFHSGQNNSAFRLQRSVDSSQLKTDD